MFDRFVEIEIWDNPQKQSSIYDDDPISQKIKNMQLLTKGKKSLKDVAENFYNQAVFMADFNDRLTDNINHIKQASEQFMQLSNRIYGMPIYDLMGLNGLRMYFTWRTLYKTGRQDINFEPYLRIFVYEILQGIYENALDKLLDILKTPDISKKLFNELLHWIMDYHIYYNKSFSDFIKLNDLEKHYTKQLVFDYNINTWQSISKCKIKDKELFLYIINNLKNKFSMPELLNYEKMPRTKWIPFIGAPFFNWLKQDDRKTYMPTGDEYILENGQWYVDRVIISKKTPNIMADIIQGKLKEAVIDEWNYNKNRIHININKDSLQKIRIDADDTLSKLVVDIPESKGDCPRLPAEKPTGEYNDFLTSLDDIEFEALKAIKHGRLDEFLSPYGIMREIIAERINEKALDIIGDNIIDSDNMMLYNEYIDLI